MRYPEEFRKGESEFFFLTFGLRSLNLPMKSLTLASVPLEELKLLTNHLVVSVDSRANECAKFHNLICSPNMKFCKLNLLLQSQVSRYNFGTAVAWLSAFWRKPYRVPGTTTALARSNFGRNSINMWANWRFFRMFCFPFVATVRFVYLVSHRDRIQGQLQGGYLNTI